MRQSGILYVFASLTVRYSEVLYVFGSLSRVFVFFCESECETKWNLVLYVFVSLSVRQSVIFKVFLF